jgi:hypothetical protein
MDLEVNAEKTKYIMSRGQNAGQGCNVILGNKSLKGWNILNIWKQF